MSHLQKNWQDFANGGYLKLYEMIFKPAQYPYWFMLQAIWSCYVVHRSTKEHKKTIPLWLRNLLISAMMSFAPRELYAYLFHRLSPLMKNPLMLLIFFAIYLAMSLCPYDIFYKIVNILYYFIGFLQGANQTRFFTLILRIQKDFSSFYLVLIAMLFTTMDQIIELILRPVLNGEETRMSNMTTITRTCLFSFIFYLTSYQNIITKFIGKYSIHITALILAFTLGLFNAAAILSPDDQGKVIRPPPPPKIRTRRSRNNSGDASDCEYYNK